MTGQSGFRQTVDTSTLDAFFSKFILSVRPGRPGDFNMTCLISNINLIIQNFFGSNSYANCVILHLLDNMETPDPNSTKQNHASGSLRHLEKVKYSFVPVSQFR